MAKSYKEIVFSVIESLSALTITDDQLDKLEPDLIGAKVKDIRAILFRNDQQERGYISTEWYSRSCCWEIECDAITCDEIVFPEKEYYVELPEMLIDNFGGIKYLGNANWSEPISELTFDEFLYVGGRIFTSKMPYYVIMRDKEKGLIALLKNVPKGWKYLCLLAPLEDPANDCQWDETMPFPMPKDLVHKLELLTIQHFVKALQLPADLVSDANVITEPAKTQRDGESNDAG